MGSPASAPQGVPAGGAWREPRGLLPYESAKTPVLAELHLAGAGCV
jgi:hypothetical protein